MNKSQGKKEGRVSHGLLFPLFGMLHPAFPFGELLLIFQVKTQMLLPQRSLACLTQAESIILSFVLQWHFVQISSLGLSILY